MHINIDSFDNHQIPCVGKIFTFISIFKPFFHSLHPWEGFLRCCHECKFQVFFAVDDIVRNAVDFAVDDIVRNETFFSTSGSNLSNLVDGNVESFVIFLFKKFIICLRCLFRFSHHRLMAWKTPSRTPYLMMVAFGRIWHIQIFLFATFSSIKARIRAFFFLR